METLNLIKNDPWLEPYADAINGRHKHAAEKEAELTNKGKQTLSDFASGYLYFGLHRTDNGWVFREWAPNATQIFLIGTFNDWKEEKKYSVSVIVNDSNNDRWIAMREGLEQAAKDDDIQLNYVSTGVFASEDEEKALIEREVENGADGIIVQLVSSEDTYAVFEKIDSSVAVMLLETDAVSEGVYSVTAPDNLWIGEALAQTVLQDYGDSLSEKKIGILSGNQNQLSMQQRLGSVKKLLEDENIEPVWILSGQGENLSSELVTKQADEPVDILITLGNAETETAVDYLQADTSYKRQFMIYGEGCSDKTVYYLDKGIIKSLVVPNEFNMGYQSVHTIAEQIKYKFSSAESTTVDSLVINRQNLYDEENQKTLFPIVQ